MNQFLNRQFDEQLLRDMYNVPSKEFSTEQIAETLTTITGNTWDVSMVRSLYSRIGLNLRERNRVAPKEVTPKAPRITKQSVLDEAFAKLNLSFEKRTEQDVDNSNVVVNDDDLPEDNYTDEIRENNMSNLGQPNGVYN